MDNYAHDHLLIGPPTHPRAHDHRRAEQIRQSQQNRPGSGIVALSREVVQEPLQIVLVPFGGRRRLVLDGEHNESVKQGGNAPGRGLNGFLEH